MSKLVTMMTDEPRISPQSDRRSQWQLGHLDYVCLYEYLFKDYLRTVDPICMKFCRPTDCNCTGKYEYICEILHVRIICRFIYIFYSHVTPRSIWLIYLLNERDGRCHVIRNKRDRANEKIIEKIAPLL